MNPVRTAIAGEIRGMFAAEPARGDDFERGIGLFTEGAVSRRVHGNVTTMMIGGISALLLQMLHPGALGGVWDHSNFRQDMLGRLRRTARFIAATTYGREADAQAAIARVRSVHAYVTGTLPDGTPYAADDPHLLNWVHITELTSFLAAWKRYKEPGMTRADQDRYFAENVVVAERLGASDVPASRAGAEAFLRDIRSELRADARVRDVRGVLMSHRAGKAAAQPAVDLILRAGADLLPDWARSMHGFRSLPGERIAVRAGAAALTRTVGWAMAG
ncbi:oxygenase MpaB family protein [Pacificimonas flava]|uniref:ER-bound oxygenase mpaB/mpaB'/Rubber oxygenase catalytic domain-containing protein n=1 Tax=Pacificimonas flava TaxID=1234595 RepID=M2U312_9SPHN|nr:oxygenase MpaB family protein [Pacificimonas flava]EMD82352.1 hypothetical protein C725_2390 [Pacificimonas flava]MBB5280742.1 uncharacterized protein (DUF2236 family) [Pacificimonas flava]